MEKELLRKHLTLVQPSRLALAGNGSKLEKLVFLKNHCSKIFLSFQASMSLAYQLLIHTNAQGLFFFRRVSFYINVQLCVRYLLQSFKLIHRHHSFPPLYRVSKERKWHLTTSLQIFHFVKSKQNSASKTLNTKQGPVKVSINCFFLLSRETMYERK